MTITLTQQNINRILRIKQDIFKSLAEAEERKDNLAIAALKAQLKKFDLSTKKFFE